MIEFYVNTYEGFVHRLLIAFSARFPFICFGIERNDLQDEIRFKLRCWIIIIYYNTKIYCVSNKTSLVKLIQETSMMIDPSQIELFSSKYKITEFKIHAPEWAVSTWKLFLRNNNSWKRFIPTHLSHFSHLIINRNLFYLIAHCSVLMK